jgi:hypothetical protein
MKKTTKKYSELNDIQKLKISKVFKYQKLTSDKNDCKIVFEGNKMVYLIVENNLIDLD